jgi:phosphatidylglycerol---prolipoprotein diacylglyceryl transferase
MEALGFLSIRLYGLAVGLGIAAGFSVASSFARRLRERDSSFSLSPDDVWGALWWVVLPGVAFARLYHVVDLWDYYREHLVLIPAVWTGGLGIFGALGGGIFGLFLYTRIKRLSFLSFSDLAGFGLPIGQAIGRWGNFFNQELYGRPTNLPWGISIRPEYRLDGFEGFSRFHPLFFYELLWSLLVFGALYSLWCFRKGRMASGSYFSFYLFLYGMGRFFLEGLRIVSWEVAGFQVAKLSSLVLIGAGGLLLYSVNRK